MKNFELIDGEEVIKQVRSDFALQEVGNYIIEALSEFNYAEKYKIIESLYTSLKEILKEDGIIIQEVKK